MLPNNLLAVIKGIIAGLAVYMVAFIFLGGLSGKPAMGFVAFFHFIGGQIDAMATFILFALGGFVVVTLNSFCGARVAARLGSSRPMLLAMIVGSSLTVVDLWALTFVHMQLVLGPFPVLLNLGGAWVAGIMEQKRRAAAETPAPAPAEAGKAESDETKRQTLHKKDDSCSVT
tara:strand:- start:88 stop:606 length:519 start_codon:yes stop_codon:yes gene_type:complete